MAYDKMISGTPWHVEKFTRAEGDSRRHRSRCIFYDKANKVCAKTVGKCYGTAHCKYYKEPKEPKVQNVPEEPDSSPGRITAAHVTSMKPKPERRTENLSEIKAHLPTPVKKRSGKAEFSVGDLIKHEKYGIGKITSISGSKAKAIFSYSIEREFDIEEGKKNGVIARHK